MRNFILKILKQNSNYHESFDGKLPIGVWKFEGEPSLITQEEVEMSSNGFPTDYRIKVLPKKISILPSLFSIYPIYFYEDMEKLLISSRIKSIADIVSDQLTINKRFLLEQHLFNYSFSTSTIYTEIRLLPSNTSVEISDKVEFKKLLTIEDHFIENPIYWKDNLGELVDLFLHINKNSIQDNDYISFTGGFDGRSLVALGKYYGKNFSTYSFGNESNDDLTLPRSQSRQLGIPFTSINLNSEYVSDFLTLGTELLTSHSLSTNLTQLHWYYSAKLLSSYTDNLVTGIFGSELFRTFHLPGQFISRHLIRMIETQDLKKWANDLKNSDEVKFLKIENFKNELEEIVSDIHQFKTQNSHLTKNMLLYKFGFEESFRKFFGYQFILPMCDFVSVQTPYLNWKFMKELLMSQFAGVNNDFMTDNPLKRFKGQKFYAELIRRTYPELLKYKTNKGYSPLDLLTATGKLNITFSFLIKRLKRNIINIPLDDLSIITSLKKNKTALQDIIGEDYSISLMQKYIDNGFDFTSELLRNKYVESLSQIIFLKKVKE